MDDDIISEMDRLIAQSLDEKEELDSSEKALRALSIAIELEQMSREYFEYLAAKTRDRSGKAMFEYLRSEEARHIKTLRTQKHAMEKDKKWLIGEEVDTDDIVCPILPKTEELRRPEDVIQNESKSATDDNDLAALATAIDLKCRTIKFYCDAKERADDDYAKRMYSHLIDMETKHLKELEVQQMWLKQAGFWYDHNMMTD